MAEDKGNTYLETVLGKIKNKFSELLKRANKSAYRKSLELYRSLQGILTNQSAPKNISPQNVADAFASVSPELQGPRLSKEITTGNIIFRQNANRLVSVLEPTKHLGRLCMFYYNAETAEKLPYWDRFPLVIPIKFYGNGFLGLNLHYLPHKERAMLMDVLYNLFYENNKHLNETQQIGISYEFLKSKAKTRLYLPCIKRYKYGSDTFKSKLLILKPDDWQIALFLPLERFDKRNTAYVHRQSLKLVQGL